MNWHVISNLTRMWFYLKELQIVCDYVTCIAGTLITNQYIRVLQSFEVLIITLKFIMKMNNLLIAFIVTNTLENWQVFLLHVLVSVPSFHMFSSTSNCIQLLALLSKATIWHDNNLKNIHKIHEKSNVIHV